MIVKCNNLNTNAVKVSSTLLLKSKIEIKVLKDRTFKRIQTLFSFNKNKALISVRIEILMPILNVFQRQF